MKRIICFIIVFVIMSGFSVAVYGAGNDDAEILYRKQFSVSGAGGLEDSLPDETKKLISDMDFSISSTDSLKSFDTKKILSCLMELAAEKSRAPFPAVFIAFGIMLLCALTGGAGLTLGNGSYQLTLSAVGTIGVCMAVIAPVCGIISSAGEVIQGAAGGVALYVPVMTGLMISTAKEIQGSSYYTLLMGVSEVIGMMSSKIIFPVIRIFLALSVTSSLSDSLKISGITNAICNCVKWVMNFSLGIFVTILSAQSLVASSLDDVSARAVRFAVNSFVPYVGSVLGETVSTFSGSLSLLKSGTGVFIIIASACMFLPVLMECIVWRMAFFLLGASAEMLGISAVKAVMRAIETVMSLITAVLLTVLMIFIISTVVVLIVGK